MTDEEDAKRGPAPTRRAFFGEHADRVRRVIRNRIDNPAAVDDIAQETWTAFLRNFEANINAREPVAVLIKIATRRVADWHRSKFSREMLSGADEVQDRLDRQLRDRLVGQGEHEVVLRLDVERLLSRLDDRQRQALHLRYLDDLDPRTAAVVMGVSRSSFYKIHDEALRQLRDSPLLAPYRRATVQKEG
ncbi:MULTISPECIES: RNA polymerase sigma factor [unclassified Saccharothrix]|uniref:RNA polymerase sigma factor n=1 Tax=unclassified Saccharothrix TaxID=2593673 RepID=UPI00307DD3E8